MLQPLSPDAAARFRDVCRAANYSEANLAETLETSIPPPPHHPQAAMFADLARGTTPFHCLATLFFLGKSVARREAAALLPGGFLDRCLECGLLELQEHLLQPLALLVPLDDWLLASDLHQAETRDDARYVPTISQPAIHLIAFSVQRPVRTVLDLCGGCGLHSMVASRFAETVVSTDLNPRAKEFAQFNAALNGCQNVEVVSGDLFEPVEGRKFDLILSNPPFVISPSESATFRDNPFELDGFLSKILTEAPAFLTDGGFFQTTCEWVETPGQAWQDRLRGWLSDCGCDAWVLQANRQLPESYARDRLREMSADENELAEGLKAWTRYFEQRRVDAIYGGLVFLRRRQGENWFDVTELSQGISKQVGDAILEGFASRDLLFSAAGDEALLACRLRVAPGLRQEEVSIWQDDGWRLESIALRLEDGLPVTIGVDKHLRDLIGLFDGRRVTEQVLDEFAKKLGMPAAAARPQSLQMVRQFMRSGILVPAS